MNLYTTLAPCRYMRALAHTCHGPLSLTTSTPFSSKCTSFWACFTFFRYWSATSNSAPTARGSGYHFVGVSVHAVIIFPMERPSSTRTAPRGKTTRLTIKRQPWTPFRLPTQASTTGLVVRPGRGRVVRGFPEPSLEAVAMALDTP